MIIKKMTFSLIVISMVMIVISSGLIISSLSSSVTREYIYYHPSRQTGLVTTNIKIPLPIPSDFTAEQTNLRVDLEKISVNKYFIVYSMIYGDQSHTAYHLYLTDLTRNDLSPAGVQEIWLEENKQKILPTAELPIIKGYPADKPLGWRIKIIVKFPYQITRNQHSLILNYKNIKFEIADITY